MNLNIQITTIIFSFLFGIFFSICLNVNYKLIYESKKIIKIIFTLVLIIFEILLYFLILLKINYGIIHIYGILSIILGFILENYLNKLFIKFYKKIKR